MSASKMRRTVRFAAQRPPIASLLTALAAYVGLAACGRTDLFPGSLAASGDAANGGTLSGNAGTGTNSGGRATGGATGGGGSAGTSAGTTSGGGGASAGTASGGATSVCVPGCKTWERCENQRCECANAMGLVSVTPKNGAPSFVEAPLRARYGCPIDPVREAYSASLYGSSTGYFPFNFLVSPDPLEVWFQPIKRNASKPAYFAGEELTAWLAPALYGPYLWTFRAAVSPSSPGIPVLWNGETATSALMRNQKLADLDGDGDLDLLSLASTGLLLQRNQGDGTFDAPSDVEVAAKLWQGSIVLGDPDDDGDLDIFIQSPTGSDRPPATIAINSGNGNFSAGPAIDSCVAVGDFNGDGTQDCIANTGWDAKSASHTPRGHVLLNDGSGHFKALEDRPFGFECSVADLDKDGSLDLACISPVIEGGRIFLNDGKGVFAQSQLVGETGARSLTLGDLDADGDVDLLIAQWFGGGRTLKNVVYLNDGKGKLTEAGDFGVDGLHVELGDLDGDGDLDAVCSRASAYTPISSDGPLLYLNDGKARFSPPLPQPIAAPGYQLFSLGDLDHDGTIDVFVTRSGDSWQYAGAWFNRK